jgi:preprotein translocase subunit SecG
MSDLEFTAILIGLFLVFALTLSALERWRNHPQNGHRDGRKDRR